MRLRSLLSSLALVSLFSILIGCGGGGGGGNRSTGTTIPANGQSTSISAAQGAILYMGGTAAGSAYPQDKVLASAPSRTIALTSLIGEVASGRYQARPATGNGWNPINGTSLFFKVSLKTLTTVEILLSTDGQTNNAGSIALTLVSGGPNHYPIVVRATLDVILENQTITGTETLTEYDSSGSNFNVKGQDASSANGVGIAFNLTDTSGTVTGNMSVTKGGVQLVYTNLTASSSGLTASFAAGAVTGSLTVNPDGSGTAQATDFTGPWSLTWDATGMFSLTAPNHTVLDGSLSSPE